VEALLALPPVVLLEELAAFLTEMTRVRFSMIMREWCWEAGGFLLSKAGKILEMASFAFLRAKVIVTGG
jgi:hypothetical protein